MANFWKIVNEVIRKSDVLLLVMDSRIPSLTKNEEIEKRVKKYGKEMIFVLNKCDLAEKKELEAWKKEWDIVLNQTELFDIVNDP